MSMAKLTHCIVVATLSAVMGVTQIVSAQAAESGGTSGFDGANFKCLDYTNGLGENATTKPLSVLGHLWMQGYLAGYYKAQGKLELSADKADEQKLNSVILQRCRDYPGSSILAVTLQAIAKDVYKMPSKTVADVPLDSYTCGQQVDAKGGAASDATKADLADLWSFAFIQGYKNVAAPQMVIATENKSVLTGAIAKNCAKNRDMTLLDMTALVAEKVKLQ